MDDTEKGCVANIEEGKHSQVFGLHTNARVGLPLPKVNRERSTGGVWVFFLHLGSWVLGSKDS